MRTYILLDRSGSMATRWTEALSSINAYVSELGGVAEATVTLATFDGQAGLQFDVLRAAVPAGTWIPVTDREATPRGMTPLFDAIGRLVGLAEADAPARAVVVVMTDGEENASREMNRDAAKAALDRARAKTWQVVFLGADFDAFGQASSVGTAADQTINAAAPALPAVMRAAAAHATAYAAEGRPIAWSESDREKGRRG